MKLGIIQGRLSLPENGYQDCPSDWKTEFDKLDQIKTQRLEIISKVNLVIKSINNLDQLLTILMEFRGYKLGDTVVGTDEGARLAHP